MKKSKNRVYAVIAAIFMLFNVLIFVIPTRKTASFWIAYVFTVVAFLVQVVIYKTSLGKAEPPKSRFFGLPCVHLGAVYLIVQLIAFAVFMAFPALAPWIAAALCVVILGAALALLATARVGTEEILRVEENVRSKTSYIRELQAEIELLAEAETEESTKDALVRLAEKVRYSDPMSSEKLAGLEAAISEKAAELKDAGGDRLKVITELDSLLTERNKKCKIYK